MLNWWKSRAAQTRKSDRIYDEIIAAARHPAFYADAGIPDNLDGRYEMIVLHLFLVMERLRGEGTDADLMARLVLERFIEDMDDCMREIGVGDLTVPKRVKKAAAGFYDRSSRLREALGVESDQALTTYFAALFDGEPEVTTVAKHAPQLARYTRAAARHLSALQTPDILDAGISFPNPDALLRFRSEEVE